MLCPPLAWDDPRQSCLHLPKVFQSLRLPKLRWWRPQHPLLRWWRPGRFPRSRPRLRPPHPCIRTAQWLLTTSLLLLLRRSPTRRFWQEFPESYHLSPSVQRSLVLWSLLARWWRRRRLDPDFPLPSQGTRIPPGLSSLRPRAAGFACPYLHPATLLLLHPGSRRWRNHGPWSTSVYASGRPSWPSRTFRPSSRTSSCRTCSCSSSFYAFYCAKKHLSSPRAFEDFPGATPPFIRTASPSSVNIAALPQTPQDAGTLSQGPTPEMVLGWKEEFMEDMKNCSKQFVGNAPPQSTVGPAVSHDNMGPDALRQLSPSDDREASRAQHKTGSKRAGSNSRRHSGSREKSSADHSQARVRRPPSSPDSSSLTRRMSPPAKRSRWDRREVSDDSSSLEGRQRSTRPRRPWQSRSPGPRRRNSSHSPSPHRRYRSSPAPSRWSSGAGMTKRLAGRPSPSPQRRSPSHHRRSRRPSRGRQSSPPSRSRDPHHRRSSSSSRSPSPKRHRTDSISPRRHGSRSASLERDSHPYDSDIRLLRLRVDNDDQHPASTHPRNSPAPGQSTSVDDSLLSVEKVQKLFDDLITPPALSRYADPIPDNASDKQLVPYVRTSTSTASNLGNSEPLETVSELPVLPSPLWRYGEGGLYGCVPWFDELNVIPNRGVPADQCFFFPPQNRWTVSVQFYLFQRVEEEAWQVTSAMAFPNYP